MTISLQLLTLVGGLLMFALAANPKLVELGKIMFFCGCWPCF